MGNIILALDDQIAKARALDSWFHTPLGMAIGQAFQQEVQRLNLLHQLSGVLQLGLCGDNLWLKGLPMNRKWLATPDGYSKQANLVCSFKQIPLERNSQELIILPFTMELFQDDSALIDEIERVLKPMGYVLILGMNRFSLWSLAARLGYFSCFPGFQMRAHSAFMVNRMMNHRQFRQIALEGFWYQPPVQSKPWIDRLHILNEMGKVLPPLPAGFYLYLGQKFVAGYPPLVREEPILNRSPFEAEIAI